MIFPVIGARVHGVLDDLVTLTYVAGALALGLGGAALAIAIGGASVHFLLTRFTNYPQGQVRLIPFRTHAFIELGEGIAVLAATWLVGPADTTARVLLTFMGASQFVAFSFSDYRWPPKRQERARDPVD